MPLHYWEKHQSNSFTERGTMMHHSLTSLRKRTFN